MEGKVMVNIDLEKGTTEITTEHEEMFSFDKQNK
jgi:hypothetical protein